MSANRSFRPSSKINNELWQKNSGNNVLVELIPSEANSVFISQDLTVGNTITVTSSEKLKDDMLKFNPFFRVSASELLKSKVFDEFRINKNEKSASEKILLEIDKDESFNYESGKSDKYTFTDYKKIVKTEATEIH